MNERKSQEQIIIRQLQEAGQVSRNWGYQNQIGRLAAIICRLRIAGWNIKTTRERTYGGYGKGLDTVYQWKDYKMCDKIRI